MTATAGPRMVLPAENVPLAPLMPKLVRAARAGDVGAMCRLAYELHRCATLPRMLRRSERMYTETLLDPDRESWQSDAAIEQSIAGNMAEQERIATVCAGVTPQRGLEPWRLLRDAARAGHLPSMVKFASYPLIDSQRYLADIDALAAYHDEGASFLLRADAAGDPTAAYHLFWAYNGSGGMVEGSGLIQRDPVRALAYDLALRDIADDRTRKSLARQEATLRRKLSQSQQREAERMGGNLARRYADKVGEKLDLEQNSRLQSAEACN